MPNQIIDIQTLGEDRGFFINGAAPGDLAGRSVAAAGDINGDGIDDIIIGASGQDKNGNGAGAAYVIYGTTSLAYPDINLGSLTPSQGFAIFGSTTSGQLGLTVSGAGDFNGDGIADIAVAATQGNGSATFSGLVSVVYGKRGDSRTNLNLSAMTAADGVIIKGEGQFDQTGFSVAAAGDVNGDGKDDLIIGAPFNDADGNNAGRAYVVLGTGTAPGTIALNSLSGATGYIIKGAATDDFTGWATAGIGDFNNDGLDDVAVGVIGSDRGGVTNGGEVDIIFGTKAVRSGIDLEVQTPDYFRIIGTQPLGEVGHSLGLVGDVNGDGFDDLLTGIAFGGTNSAGRAAIVFGGAGATHPNVTISPGQTFPGGVLIDGATPGALFGYTTMNTPIDFNSDGFPDFAFGSTGGAVGADHILLGGPTFPQHIGIGDANPGLPVIEIRAGANDELGYGLAGLGDINNDGADDFAIGLPGASKDTGSVFVLFGEGGNHAPVARDDIAYITISDPNVRQSIQITVLDNDSDIDGDELTILDASGAKHGSLGDYGEAPHVSYSPDPTFDGQDSFTYKISDGKGGTATATVTVIGNHDPIARDDVVRVKPGQTVIIDPLANDSDADGDAIVRTLLAADTLGEDQVVVRLDGKIEYTPAPGFHGTRTFTYIIQDLLPDESGPKGGSATGKIEFIVDNAPTTAPDTATTTVIAPITFNVLANDSDLDLGDKLGLTNVTNGAHGTVTIASNSFVTYLPQPGFTGKDSFTYTVGDGLLDSTETVTVQVDPVPVMPVTTLLPGQPLDAGGKAGAPLVFFVQGTTQAETIALHDHVVVDFSLNFRNSNDTLTLSGAAPSFLISFDGGNYAKLFSAFDDIKLTLPVQAGFGILLNFETAPGVLGDMRMLRLVADDNGDGLNDLFLGSQRIEPGAGETAAPFAPPLPGQLLETLAGQSFIVA